MSTNGTSNGTGHGDSTPPPEVPVHAHAHVPNCLLCGRPAVKTAVGACLQESVLLAYGMCEDHVFRTEPITSFCVDMALAVLKAARQEGGGQ